MLLEEFLPHDFDYRLMLEIRSRTQGSDESIVQYLSIMQNYFARLRNPLSESEKLDIVKYNVRPFYTTQLGLVDCKKKNTNLYYLPVMNKVIIMYLLKVHMILRTKSLFNN